MQGLIVPLPFCHSRRELPTESGAMYCVHPRVHVDGLRVNSAICKMCDYWKEPAPAEFRPFPPPPPRGRCAFLGEVTGFRECKTCSGRVHLKVFACAHPAHMETTWDECLLCPDHQETARVATATQRNAEPA
jgi:hypothetical protein